MISLVVKLDGLIRFFVLVSNKCLFHSGSKILQKSSTIQNKPIKLFIADLLFLFIVRNLYKITEDLLFQYVLYIPLSRTDVKIERRADMYISTLRGYIEAMGGELEITAHFPDTNVRINQFHQLDPNITEVTTKIMK